MTNLGYAQTYSSTDRISSVSQFDDGDTPSIVDHLDFENIGPTVFSGRVVDIAVDPTDPAHFYVAYASGGLWETTNNGTSFDPMFDNEAVITIGAIAVDWQRGVIWVGTGEVNSSRSSYAGVGLFRSNDNGKTWEYSGLPESHHIGRILLHPNNPDNVYVAVLGHLYSNNPERGVYQSKDSGETWEHSLTIDESTGVVDLVMDPDNPDIIYAAAWERIRKSWNFTESGPGSGIYKTTDGGENWSLITTESSGFPVGEGVGRIGLAVSGISGQTRLYALLDNYFRRTEEASDDEELTKNDFKTMTNEALASLDNEKIETYLRSNRFPRKYKAEGVKKMVAKKEIAPADLAYFLENANSLLFDTPVIGAELYQSNDGGESWVRTHDEPLDGLYFSYGYYFGVVSADPSNAEQVYIGGVPILSSEDGGKSFVNINGDNVHSDHHKIWVNPSRPGHLIIGNDGGVNISYDNGKHWIKCNTPAVGQFYYINVDHAEPYHVYGGTQDNGVWKGSHTYNAGTRWHSTGNYPYDGILGGDGMQVQIDSRDNTTVYTGFQFGNYFRINTANNQRTRITPLHELGQRPYRWNWQSPIHLSTHNQDIVYFGAHVLFRSMNQGEDFESISPDLTKGGKQGDVPFGTLSTIHESPLRFGLLYTGSDDGLINVSKDGGVSWTTISDALPQDLWVARVQASSHSEGRVYVALNGYRNDDFSPYVYMSTDYGETWKDIGNDLPKEPVNVIKEDPEVEDLLYLGTDRASYVSMDRGTSWTRLKKGLTSAPVHDIVIQSESKDLLIGTHGRSIFKGHIGNLQAVAQMEDPVLTLFEIPKMRYRSNLGNRRAFYLEYAKIEVDLDLYTSRPGAAEMIVQTEDEVILHQRNLELPKGFSTVTFDLAIDDDAVESYKTSIEDDKKKLKKADNGKHYLLPGKYTIKVTFGEESSTQNLEITE